MKRSLMIAVFLVWCFVPLGQVQVLADPTGWQSVPGPLGGSVAALVMSPAYASDHTAFAGLRGRGVYRTVDGGNAWRPLGLLDQVIIDLAISPNFAADHTFFAAVGLGPGSYTVYRSTDGGATWLQPYLTPYADGFKTLSGLSISPNYSADHTVYALGTAETYRSTDGGLVFVKAGGWFASHQVTALAFSPVYATDHTLFAAVAGMGVMKSIDGGGAWTATSLNFNSTALAVSPNYATDQMLAAIDAVTGHLFASTDGGVTRRELSLSVRVEGKHTLLFSHTFVDDHVMLAASSGDLSAYRSDDSGETWIPVGGFVGGGVFALALSPNTALDARAFAGASSGLYTSSDRGISWSQDNHGLPRLSVHSLAIAPNDPGILLAGTSFFEHKHFNANTPIEADGNFQLSKDGGQTWQVVIGLIDRVQQVAFSPDFANDQRAFAVTGVIGQDGYAQGGIYRSFNGGVNWEAVLSNAPCTALALSPNFAVDHTAWAYASSGPLGAGVLRSTDRGETWSRLSTEIAAETIVPSSNYAVDHVLFASTADGRLQKSIDGGEHWTPILNHPITALAISPAYGASQTLYAGVKETPNSSGELYRSGDGGATWQLLNTGIPVAWNSQKSNISVLSFAADGSVLAGVTYGDGSGGTLVYRSSDGAQTWQALGSDLTEVSLFDLTSTFNGNDSDQRGALTFYASTNSAVWRIDQQQRDPTEPGAWQGSGLWGGRAGLLAVSPNFVDDGLVFSGEVNEYHASEWGPGLSKSSDGGQTWRSVSQSADGSIALGGEAVHAYTFSPNFAADQLVFASTSRGLYQSTNGGDTWRVIEGVYTGFPGGVRALVLAPDYPTSGEMIATGGWGTLVVSRDFGQTWSGLPVPSSGVATYSPNFTVDHTIFTSGNDIDRSTDRGLSWTPVLTQGGYLALSPQFGVDHTAFAASTSWSGGVSKTLDSGTTWTPVLTGYVRLYLSPQYGTDQTIFALSNIEAGPYGANILYRSINGGATWITKTIGLSTTNIGGLILSPAFNVDHLMYAPGTDGLYRSSNGGLTWSVVPDFAHGSVSTVVFSPGWPAQPYLLVGTSQSVYRSIDGGTTWARMQGVRLLNASPLALAANDAQWFTGSEDGVYTSADHGQTWSPLGSLSAYINELAVSPAYASDHTVFATTSCNGCSGVGINRTTDGGETWKYVRSSDYGGALAISPQYATDHTIYVLGRGVSRSSNGGDSWTPIGTWPNSAQTYRWIALPPNYPDDSTIFVASPGFWRLPPGETEWQPAASGILSTTDISAIAVAPNYTQSHTLLAATVDYEMDGGHSSVFRSEDGGVNWQRSDSGLPNADWRSLAFSPRYAADHTVYLVSPQRLYRSIDNGHSWVAVGATPADLWLNQVAVSHAGEVIVSSSSGVQQYRTGFRDILLNGDAEADSGWSLSADSAGYATEISYHAQHGLRLGLANGSNRPIDSFATQTVTIPISATLAQLTLRLYPVSSEASLAPHSQAITPGDAQYVRLTLSGTHGISATLLWTLSNAQAWQRTSFDLTSYAGQTIGLRLGVINRVYSQ